MDLKESFVVRSLSSIILWVRKGSLEKLNNFLNTYIMEDTGIVSNSSLLPLISVFSLFILLQCASYHNRNILFFIHSLPQPST